MLCYNYLIVEIDKLMAQSLCIKMALLSKNEKIANVSVENHKIILAC